MIERRAVMSIDMHPDYPAEKLRLQETMTYIENVILAIEESRSSFKDEIKDAYMSLDPSDSSLSYMSIMLNTKLLDQLEKNYRNYKNVRRKPYFARIDIQQKGEKQPEKLYIGKASLFNKDMEPVIIDWRSPIASVYYDGRLGHVAYKTNEEMIEAELFLKRQYTISDGQLENMMDIDLTANDAFLQASLSGYADDRLKDIASTIQAEQNAIIRSDLDRPLIVQGVAGSGKTTIALHRIAYLIYTYEEKFDPDQFMIIAPNRLFLNYIADVLPELGVEQVRQTTFIDFVFEIIGQKFQLTQSDEKLLALIETNKDQAAKEHSQSLIKVSEFKGSLLLKYIIDRYIAVLEQDFVPDQDFYADDLLILTAQEINNVFLYESHYSALYKRMNKVKKVLNSTLKGKINAITSKLDATYDQKIALLRLDFMMDEEDKRTQITQLLQERDEQLDKINRSSKNAVTKYMSKFPKMKLMEYYKTIITSPSLMKNYSGGILDIKLLQQVSSYSSEILERKKIELEDLAPLLYLQDKLYGLNEKIDVKYVVIDEAQDFSLFQFYALKTILNTDRFTILGDLSQGIHSYKAIKNWETIIKNVFTPEKSIYLTLEQSYRTTVEIMEAANKVIKLCPIEGLILAKPVVRHGEHPESVQLATKELMIPSINKKLEQFVIEGFHSIAIIGKTLKECEILHKALKHKGENKITLLDGKEDSFHHGIVLVPSYLAKGLEFDAVIIVQYEETYTEDELDLKLLYVAMTRALHRVSLFYTEETMGIMKKI